MTTRMDELIASVAATVDIPMPPTVKINLAKAGIVPPTSGTKLSVADVDAKLLAASIKLPDRVEVKQQLARAGLL